MAKLFKKMKALWEEFGRPIYVGKRLESNLRVLTYVSIVTALLGLVLTVMDIARGEVLMSIAAIMTFLSGLSCAYFAGVKKNRKIAATIPTIFCLFAFTFYAFTGIGAGLTLCWSLLLPLGISYFVGIREGIILSVYYSVLYVILFYTPVRNYLPGHYIVQFATRFPLLFIMQVFFSLIAMGEYHCMTVRDTEYSDRLNEEVERQTAMAHERAERLEALSDEMVETLALTIDAKDRYTNGHSFRVSWYATALARQLGWSDDALNELEREAMLHDIGKIGVPDLILNKSGRLNEAEFDIIKSHTTIGGEILSRSGNLLEAAQVARYHHERYDGHGYPDGLAGERIPLHARVVAIADAYDAMRSDRIYRKGLSSEEIREEFIRGRGAQFDPQLVDVFLGLMDAGALEQIAERDLPEYVGVKAGS